MSENASGADNQQGSCSVVNRINPSETTRRAPAFQKIIMAYFLGALHDGTFSSNERFRISQKGDDWLKVLRNFLKEIGFSAWIYQEGKTRDIYVLETLAKFLDFQFNPEDLKTQEEKTAYIRGFFDAEGGIYPPQKSHSKPYLYLHSKHQDNLNQVANVLSEFQIESRIWRTHINEYCLSIGKKASRIAFSQIVGFGLPRKQSNLEKYGGL